jgi:ectoine hydroxylase-related dioxygenase (phytanoyl-CoA dioxygenase family)
MIVNEQHKINLIENGFATVNHIYSDQEVEQILNAINHADNDKETFRKSSDLFAIRQFLKEIPAVVKLVFNTNLKELIQQIFGNNYVVVKSIYFDKPETSNWYVAYHQDLTISVDKKVELDTFGPWTIKQNQFAVQPPIHILENMFTIRIHLDDTDEHNGALKVIPASHLKKIYRPENIQHNKETEHICEVKKGGVMLMKPLILHSSSRTSNKKRRRVIHIEFSNQELPSELQWAERLAY